MNYTDRNDIYSDDKFVGQVRMALCDWVEYWAVTGTSSIDDPELRNLTDSFIRCAVSGSLPGIYAISRKSRGGLTGLNPLFGRLLYLFVFF